VGAWNKHEAIVKLLLEKGVDVKSRDRDYGQTPLSWAAAKEHETAVKLLLKKGADMESKGNFDQIPLLLAAWSGHEAAVKLLLGKGAEPSRLEKAKKALLAISSSFRTFISFVL
jgi:ankyrin repeat protein